MLASMAAMSTFSLETRITSRAVNGIFSLALAIYVVFFSKNLAEIKEIFERMHQRGSLYQASMRNRMLYIAIVALITTAGNIWVINLCANDKDLFGAAVWLASLIGSFVALFRYWYTYFSFYKLLKSPPRSTTP